jgi:hypothetical protein
MRAPTSCVARSVALPLATALALALAAAPLAAPLGAQGREASPPAPGAPLRLGVEADLARVLTARAGTVVPTRDVFLRGLDFEYRPAAARWGLQVRARQSTRSDDLRVGLVAAAYSFGPVSAELGYAWRAGYELATGLAHGEMHGFARAGGAVRIPLAATPLSLEGRAAVFVPVSGADRPEDALRGFDGETAIRWGLTRLPLDAVVGFRFERLRVYRTEQEVSALRMGVAWRGGWPR